MDEEEEEDDGAPSHMPPHPRLPASVVGATVRCYVLGQLGLRIIVATVLRVGISVRGGVDVRRFFWRRCRCRRRDAGALLPLLRGRSCTHVFASFRRCGDP